MEIVLIAFSAAIGLVIGSTLKSGPLSRNKGAHPALAVLLSCLFAMIYLVLIAIFVELQFEIPGSSPIISICALAFATTLFFSIKRASQF